MTGSHDRANINWTIPAGPLRFPHAQLAVLMDIRRELQKLNQVFERSNALAIPGLLRRIEVNTRRPKPTRRRAAGR